MGVQDPLEMSDTEEEHDIVPKTQQDSDSSDEDIGDTKNAPPPKRLPKGKGKGKGKRK